MVPSAVSYDTVRSPLESYITALLEDFRDADEGDVATYIPELGRADPNWFSICGCTTDGHVYEVGDSDVEFTIQSISKAFVFGAALGLAYSPMTRAGASVASFGVGAAIWLIVSDPMTVSNAVSTGDVTPVMQAIVETLTTDNRPTQSSPAAIGQKRRITVCLAWN